jgi:hypothetical protein
MCRYAFSGPYKEKWACFSCRKSFKTAWALSPPSEWAPLKQKVQMAEDTPSQVLCPQCRQVMHNMGLDFKAPARTDIKQWRKVEILFYHGYDYSSCGCNGPGLRPARLKDVPDFLRAEEQHAVKYQRARRISAREEELTAKRQKKREQLQAKRLA